MSAHHAQATRLPITASTPPLKRLTLRPPHHSTTTLAETGMGRTVGGGPIPVSITVPRHASAAATDELIAEVKKLAEAEGKHFRYDFGGTPQTARSRAMASLMLRKLLLLLT